MKALITILFFLIFANIKAQTVPVKLDTIPQILTVMDSTHYWNYYKKNGTISWRDVKGYDAKLIPAGGYAIKTDFVNPVFFGMEGYLVIRMRPDSVIETINYINKLKQPVGAPNLLVWPFTIPVNGFKFQ